MKASIIIPTSGARLDYLTDALYSLGKQNFPKSDYEIIVVDNNPAPVIFKKIDEFNRSADHVVRYVHEPHQGATEARHAGARVALGEILVYTDDDVIVSTDWLKSILDPFQNPRVGCAGGKTIAQWDVPTPQWFSQLKHMALGMLDLGDQTLELKGCQIWSNNLAVRKSVLYEVGGYNPDIYGGGTDGRIWHTGDGECGLEKKILEHGYKLIYEPRAWMYHRVSAARATKEYFYKRSFIAAVASSFTQVRKMRKAKLLPLRLLIKSGVNFLKSDVTFLKSWFLPSNSVKVKTLAYGYAGKANHQLRAAFSQKLREHIFKDSYID